MARISFKSATVEQKSHSGDVLLGYVGEVQGHLPVRVWFPKAGR